MKNEIVKIFEGFRMNPTPIDQFESVGKKILTDKIAAFVDQGKPIDFVMLGFPMKSQNDRDKVLGKLPDLGEEVTFQNFSRFNEEIKKVYSAGINLSMVSDGYVFSDVLGVQDRVVDNYVSAAKEMSSDSPLTWYDLKSFYSNFSSAREKLMGEFGVAEEEMQRRILFDPDVNFLYRGMMRFMEEEFAMRDWPSHNQLHKYAKTVTREMMMRNEAYSHLVQKEFSSSIRLSMHPSVNNGNKYSFRLIPSPKAWTSPWHSALLIKDGVYETIHKKDAVAAGYNLVMRDGRPYNYVS